MTTLHPCACARGNRPTLTSSHSHGECAGKDELDAFRAGNDGGGGNNRSACNHFGVDNASIHLLQEDP